jgi:beta-hydroxylase
MTFLDFFKFKIGWPFVLWLGARMNNAAVIKEGPVISTEHFPWVNELKQHWKAVQSEARELLEQFDRLPSLKELNKSSRISLIDHKWKTFFFYGYGFAVKRNLNRCPQTAKALKAIPGLKTAFFSLLSPKKHIGRHKGVYKGLIRCHLALIIPGHPGDCGMEILDQEVHWKEGEVIAFDDTVEHEAWNNTDEFRVILLFDIERQYRFPFNVVNKLILWLFKFTDYVRDVRRRHVIWEEAFYQPAMA